MKIFISQPMNGYSREEILEERERIKAKFSGNEFIDSYIEDVPEMMGDTRVWCLGESIKMMANANMVIIPTNCWEYPGCMVEADVADAYGMPVVKIPMYPNHVSRCANIASEGELVCPSK